ncbi:MAG: LysM peptidoglycan-binding domain-containing protein [Chloroflexi bacterium]|nr:LysM peptidoglycan-binding domain-containing protein [Chloroflexota bacterium]
MRRLLPLVILLALLAAMAFPAGAQGTIEHIVDRGETLSSIARHYQTTVRAIMAINPSIWNPNILWAGLRLQVPVGQIPSPDPMPPQPPQPPSGGICSYYVVRHGDTLTGIANWFAVSPWDIARANNILNLNHIYSGMYLAIPCSGGMWWSTRSARRT